MMEFESDKGPMELGEEKEAETIHIPAVKELRMQPEEREIIKDGITLFFAKQVRLHDRVLRAHSIPVDISLEEAGMTHTVAGQKSLPINLSSTSY